MLFNVFLVSTRQWQLQLINYSLDKEASGRAGLPLVSQYHVTGKLTNGNTAMTYDINLRSSSKGIKVQINYSARHSRLTLLVVKYIC